MTAYAMDSPGALNEGPRRLVGFGDIDAKDHLGSFDIRPSEPRPDIQKL